MRRIRPWPLPLALLAACAAAPPDQPPARLVDLPWQATPADQVVLRARGLVERGQPAAALPLLDGVLAEHPGHVDAARLRQDVLRDRGRLGRLWHEAEQRLRAAPDDAVGHYLRGRIVADPAAKLQSFGRAAALAPASLWPWLGLAHTLRDRDPAQALGIYDRLQAASEGHPLVAIAHAALLRQLDQPAAALPLYAALQRDARLPGVGDLGLAQTLVALDRRAEGFAATLAALRQRPFDPGVQALLHGWLQAGLTDDQTQQVFDVLREEPARLEALAVADGVPLLADLLLRVRQPQAARELLARVDTARRPALRRLWRRLHLEVGDVAAFLAVLQQDLPRAVIDRETNRVRGRWLALLDGPWHRGDPLATAAQSEALLDALLGTGLLAEAEQVAHWARARHPGAAAALAARRDEARRQLAFEAGLRRLLYQGYQAADTSAVPVVLERLRGLSLRVLGRDVVGKPVVFDLPMVGELVDPFQGELAAHFDRYNRHFILGRRAGGTAEGMLLTRLVAAELDAGPDLPLAGRCQQIVAIDRDVRALSGVLGGDLAGVALLNHYLVDYDAVRDWARSIADRRRIAAEDGMALALDPLPATAGDHPLDVAWRLAVLSPVQDTELDLAVLDTICQHERQHLVDSFHYLPIEANLFRGMGLLVRFGFSPAAIEAEMERRAELAALAVSPHTELVLAHIADFLGEPEQESPHHHGFAALAGELGRALRELGAPADHCVPSRWHLLDRALVRRAARRLLDEVP